MRFRVAFPTALAAATLVGLVPSALVAQVQPEITQAQPELAKKPLTIRTAKRAIRFDVEMAVTDGQQEAGLMWRKSVPPFGGMIFPRKPPSQAVFWMHNTIIPLDMVFIRANGTIARIITAPKLSDNTDDSVEPVAAVLELGAGRAKALGIKAGDKVSGPAFEG
jgi:uncharacterized membrane protein (UPF0127 family)